MKKGDNLILLLLFILTSCSVTTPEKNLFLINKPAKKSFKQINGNLKIDNFNCAEYLNDERIIYMPDSISIGYYNFQLWAVSLPKMLKRYFYNFISENKIFKKVYINNINETPDYHINANINYFGEFDIKNERYAKIDILISIIKSDGTIKQSKRYIKSRIVNYSKNEKKFAKNLVSEINNLLNEILSDYFSNS